METGKCDDLSWFDLDDLPKNIVPYIKQSIESILSGNFYDEREGDERGGFGVIS